MVHKSRKNLGMTYVFILQKPLEQETLDEVVVE